MKAAWAILIALSSGGDDMASAPEDCRQGNAIYGDQSGAYRLSFAALDSEASFPELEFKLETPDRHISFNGYITADDTERPADAILFHNCPEGDVTGDDLRACTIWEGAALVPQEAGDFLPANTEKAVSALELSGFRRALERYAVRQRIQLALPPDDRFALTGCSEHD